MTTFKTQIENTQTISELEAVFTTFSEKHLDENTAFSLDDFQALETQTKKLNEKHFSLFCYNFFKMLETDRKTAFENLVENPHYTTAQALKDDGKITLSINEKTLFKFSDLEKQYQLSKSESVNKKGQPIPNISKSIFGSLRFYTVVDSFMRNLFLKNVEIDDDKKLDLSRVKLDDVTIFDEKDGTCFSSNKPNDLKKQLNIIVRFMGFEPIMWRDDILPLKLTTQKIKIDKSTLLVSVHEIGKKDKNSNKKDNAILRFTDLMFAVIATRKKHGGVKLYDAEGKLIVIEDKKAK